MCILKYMIINRKKRKLNIVYYENAEENQLCFHCSFSPILATTGSSNPAWHSFTLIEPIICICKYRKKPATSHSTHDSKTKSRRDV